MLNKVILLGRLTTDPEVKQTPNGIPVTSFSLAVNRKGNREQTDFIPVVAWRHIAELIGQYFGKGQQIVIEGCIQTRKYTDKNGSSKTAFEVIAEHIYFTDGVKSNRETQKNQLISNKSVQPKQLDIDMNDYEEVFTSDENLPF